MKKETMIIAIFVALILLWIAETLEMRKTKRLLSSALDIGFQLIN